MEAHVDVAAALGVRVVVLKGLAQRPPFLLQAERKHGGVAAKSGRTGAGLEIVCHDDVGAVRLCQMHVTINAARQHELAALRR